MILRSDRKRHARLNSISHLLSLIPYEKIKTEKIKLPKRSEKDVYNDAVTLDGRKFVPDVY